MQKYKHFGRRLERLRCPLGVILLLVATAVHPSRENNMNHEAVFKEYPLSDGWIPIRFTQWVPALVFFSGLIALCIAMTAQREGPTVLARFDPSCRTPA